jgi:hypothetical protein
MRLTAVIGGLQRASVEKRIYDQISELCPEGDNGRRFRFEFETNDDRLLRIQDILARGGYKVWDEHGYSLPNEYRLTRNRYYDPGDLASVYYCEPWATDSLETANQRTLEGVLAVSSNFEGEPPPIGMVGVDAMAVSDRLKSSMEEAGLVHLILLPARVVGENASSIRERYWELTSDLRLPRLAPNLRLIDGLGGLYEEGKSHACIVDDGFSPPELHYRASDIARVEPFDLARTHEPIGSKAGTFVASKRFYEFCRSHSLKMDWVPVRIDRD